MKYLKITVCYSFLLFTASLPVPTKECGCHCCCEKLNEKEMKSLGMKISAKDIYSINSGSLKDAIVSFGGFVPVKLFLQKDWY